MIKRGRPPKTLGRSTTSELIPLPANLDGGSASSEVEERTVDDVESFEVSSLTLEGRMHMTHGRRARRHVSRERNDREAADLPDEPPPGWCEV